MDDTDYYCPMAKQEIIARSKENFQVVTKCQSPFIVSITNEDIHPHRNTLSSL